MSRRAWMSGCIVAGTLVFAWAGSITGMAQAAEQTKTVAEGWVPPRTPWGDPDLQGVYSRMHFVAGAVPFERRPELGTRKELTEAELQARMAARDKQAGVGLSRPTGVSFDDVISPYLTPSRRTSVVVDPPDGRLPPYTVEGRKKMDAMAARRRPATTMADIGPENFRDEERCITRGFPTTMNPATPTSAGMQILQGPGWVVLHFELLNEYRLIPVDPRPSLGPKLRQWWGQSRGRWEGNTLVVEVTNFNGRSDDRLGATEQLRVIERFTPVSHGEIEYSYTVEDPGMFTRPWTIEASWGRHDQLEITEYACHPGNRDLPKMIVIAQKELERKTQSPQEAAAPAQGR